MPLPRTLRRWSVRLLAALVALVLVLVAGVLVWARTGIRTAEEAPFEEVRANPGIIVREYDDAVVLQPGDATASTPEGTGYAHPSEVGIVLLPGAKVDAEAYANRFAALVEQESVTVVIAKPYLHLALLDPRGLDTFTARAPDVGTWAVGGHSLGGVRACQLAADADALILLASYCAEDLSGTDVPVLSLAGSEDALSTPAEIAGNRDRLPADAQMVEIAGASHASFGDYGPQKGDGTPTISDEQMTSRVTDEVTSFLTGAGLL